MTTLAFLGKRVQECHDDASFKQILQDAGKRLVVVDFFATWCKPCQQMKPVLDALCKKYPRVVFLAIDVDKNKATAMSAGIKAMPTFAFYKEQKQLAEETVRGAEPQGLEAAIVKLNKTCSPFSGAGHSLTGPSTSSSSAQPDQSAPKRFNPWAQQNFVPQYQKKIKENVAHEEEKQQESTSSTTTSAASASSSAPLDGVEQLLMTQLVDMGFSQPKSERCMRSRHPKNIEDAITWMEEHEDDDEDAVMTDATSTPAPTSTSTPTPAQPTGNQRWAPLGHKQGEAYYDSDEEREKQRAASLMKGAHSQTAKPSPKPKSKPVENLGKPLTAQEKVDRLREKRKKGKEEEAKIAGKNRELRRRATAHEGLQLKRDKEERQRQQVALRKKKERDEEKRRKAKIKEKMKLEKERRVKLAEQRKKDNAEYVQRMQGGQS